MSYSELHPGLCGLIYDISAPEQLVCLPEQLVSATEQLRTCAGAVSKVSRNSYKSVPEQLVSLRNTYKSSVAVISLSEHL